MRMLFDQGSANKMQSQYMGRLSKLEKDASAMTARANNALMSQHRTLVKNLEAENDAASEKLKAKQKTIATQVSANAKKAMEALKPDARKLGGRSSAEYKQQEAEYNAMLEKMQTGNAKYVAKAPVNTTDKTSPNIINPKLPFEAPTTPITLSKLIVMSANRTL